MTKSRLYLSFIYFSVLISHATIAQKYISQNDSIEINKIDKWVRIAKKEYPLDTIRQNVSIFANLFWGDKNNANIIGVGMNNFWKYNLQSNVKSFQGSFSFLVSFDDEGEVQKLSFSKNVPPEFISVVQGNFQNLLLNISQKDRLKGVFKNQKILLRLHLVWSFTNSQTLKDYVDDGLNTLEFKDEGSTIGEVLMAPPNFMSCQI